MSAGRRPCPWLQLRQLANLCAVRLEGRDPSRHHSALALVQVTARQVMRLRPALDLGRVEVGAYAGRRGLGGDRARQAT